MVKSVHMTKICSALGLRRIVPFYLIEMNHYSISFETSNVLPIYTKLLVRWGNIWSDTFDPHLCENSFNKISIFFRRKKPLPLWHYPIRNWLTSAAPSPGPNWKVWLPISNLKSLRGTFVSSVQKPNSPYFSLGVIIVNFANKMCAPNAFQRWDLQIVFHKFVEFHEVNNTIQSIFHSESPLSTLPWKCVLQMRFKGEIYK